jgi:GYF domain 2
MQSQQDKARVAALRTPPASASRNWYYVSNGHKLGPESSKTLMGWLSSGTLSPDDLVWRKGMSEWKAIRYADLSNDFFNTPPPLIGESVNNIAVWLWAFVPLIPIYTILLATGLTISGCPWIVAIIINTVFWWIDGQQIKKAGYDRSAWGVWGILFVPVYLFIRAAKLRQNNGYAIVWLFCFGLSIFDFGHRF